MLELAYLLGDAWFGMCGLHHIQSKDSIGVYISKRITPGNYEPQLNQIVIFILIRAGLVEGSMSTFALLQPLSQYTWKSTEYFFLHIFSLYLCDEIVLLSTYKLLYCIIGLLKTSYQ